jgi:hypothetical protein
VKNTQFGISNPDVAEKVNKSKGLVQLMKEVLEKEQIQQVTKILQLVKSKVEGNQWIQ